MSNKVDLVNPSGPACLSGDALVSYLYDECTFEERQRAEQHLASCIACASEIETLGATRVQLVNWTPPDAALGFRISAAAASNVAPFTPATVREPWWRQPLPAWGQAVAATVLFGLGMAAGTRQVPVAPVSTESGRSVPASFVSPSQLTSLETQLRREIAAMRPAAAAPVARVVASARLDDSEREALLRQVRQMVRESEDRQQQAFTLRAAQVARDAEIQRRVDVANMRQSLEQMQGSTSEVQRQQAELYKILVNNAALRR